MENTLYMRIINPQEIENGFMFQKMGHIWPMVEMFIYQTASKISKNPYYRGSWEFIELGNKGWYMRPKTQEKFLAYNWEEKPFEVSNDAFGIILCEYVFSALSLYFHERGQENHKELMIEHYLKLQNYIEHSPEASEISYIPDIPD